MGAGSSTVKAPPESPQDAREPGAAEAPALAKQETGSALAEEATAAAAPEPQGDHATSAAPASPKKNGQINDINGMPEGQVGDPYKEQDEAVILEVGQRDLENMFEKDDVSDTLVSQTEFFVVDVQESEQETIEEMPLSEDSTEELEQPSESSDVGYKKVFKFVGVKLTVKKDKNDKSDEVDDGGPNGSEDCQDYSSENELESQKQSILSIDNEKDDKQEKVGNITGYESTSSLKKFFSLGWIGWRKKSSIKKYKEDDEPEVSEKEKEQEVGKMDLVEIYEGKKEETAEHPTVSEPLPPNEAIEMLSEKEKVVRSPKDEAHEIQLSSEEKAAPLATEVFDEKIETIAEIHASSVEEQEQTENPSTDVEQVDVSLFPASATNETKLGVTGMLAKTSELVCTSKDVSETSPEESVLCQQREGITSEVEILSSQERGRLQGSPLKKLFSGTGLKKLSGKKYKGKKGDEEIKSQELGELTQVSVDSSETPEDQKGESSASSPDELAIEKGIVDTPQEVGIEDEGTISDSERRRESGVTPWASFKKMVTPKKRVRKLSESDKEDEIEKVKSATLSSTESTASDNQEELKGNGDDQKTEEPKRKVDTSVSWEALICVGSSKKRARKSSSSDEEGGPKVVSVEYYKSEDLGKNKESGTEITPIHSFEGDQGQINSSPELAGSPVEGEGVSTWVSFKRLVTPRKKSKSKMEERNEESIILSGTEHSASDIEPVKEESWVSIKKLIPGRRKKKFEGKQGQVPFEEDQTGVIEDDSDIPAVVPLSEYDAAEQEKNEARYAENIKAAKDLHKEKSGKLEEGLETGEHIEGLVHAATVTVVEGERAVTSIEERSPSWISTTITESVEEATDQPEEQTEEIFEQEVLVKRPATKTLRGTKDISRGPIDSELGLTSETVTAVKEATDEPKQPNGKIGEKEILVERPGTKSLREAKDTSRDLIVSELELTSEAVTAVKEAGERPKQPTEEIVEKEVLVERPGTKSLRDVKDTSRDPIVSKLELTSEAVTAAKDATNQPGQPIRKIFEKEKTEKKILVEKPVAKTFRGTKDSSRIPIVSELKLTSKAVTAAKEATDQPKQQTRKISEKEKSEKKALVEKPIAKTFRGTKDSSRIPIVSELKQTSVAVTAAKEARDGPKQPTGKIAEKEKFEKKVLFENPGTKSFTGTKDTSRGPIVSELELTSEAVTAAKEARDGPKQPTGKIAEKEKFEKEVLVERPATKTLTEANDTSRGPIVSELGLTSEAVTAAKEARDGPKQPTGKIAEKKKSEKKVLFEKPGTKSFTGTKDTGRGPIVSELDPTSEASSSSSSAAMISALSHFSDSSYPGFATTVEKVDSHTPALTKQTQDGVQVAFENVKQPRDVSLREAKDTSKDLIVSELELPSEAVTAAKQAGEKPKQPAEERVEEEAKDTSRDLIVSELELPSEAVTAAKQEREKPKQPTEEIVEEAKDMKRDLIVSKLEVTSEAVPAAEEATEAIYAEKITRASFASSSDYPSSIGMGSEPSWITDRVSSSSLSAALTSALSHFSDSSYPGFATTVEKVDSHTPALTKQTQDGVQVAFENVKPSRDVSLREAKDTSRDLIVSELELPSEAVTAAKQAGEKPKPAEERVEEEAKDTSRDLIVSELELPSEAVTAAKQEREKPKQPTEEIVEEAKDMRRDLIVSKLEVTSEAVPAEAATEAIYAEKITRASFASSSDYPSSIGMGSEPSWITDMVSSSSSSAAMISALSHFSDSSYPGFATTVEKVDSHTPALTKQTQDGVQVAFENVKQPRDVSLREAKDTSKDLIVSELELPSEAVTAAKQAGEKPKQPAEERVEEEAKDISRAMIVNEVELTSEAVPAAEEATEAIYAEKITRASFASSSDYPSSIGMGSEPSWITDMVSSSSSSAAMTSALSHFSDSSYPGFATTVEKVDSHTPALTKQTQDGVQVAFENVKQPRDVSLREAKDTSKDLIVSELELPSEAVTAAKQAGEKPKQPAEEIVEEAKDISRAMIVSKLEVTSEAVPAAEEATEAIYAEKITRASFASSSDYPSSIGMGSEPSWITDRVSSSSSSAAMTSALSHFSDSSYPGFATTVEKVDSHTPALTKQTQDGVQVAFENVKPSRDVSLREAKDTSRDLIVSELELPSEAVTAAKQAGEKPKQPTEEIVEEAKDMRRDLIVSKLEVTSEAVPAAEEATEAIYADKITRASFASSSDYPSSIGMGSEPSWITDRVSSSSLSAAMISALSHFSDSSYTTGFATPMEEVDVDTPDLEALTKQTQDVLQVAFENVKQSRDVMLTTQSLETNSNYHQETNLTMGEAAVMHDEVQEKVQTRKTEDITINDEQDEIIEQITSETFDKLEAAESRIEVQECKTLNDFLTCQAERTIQTPQIPMKPRIPVEITTDEGTLVIHFQDKSIRQEQPVVFQEVSEGSDSAPALGSEVVQTKKTEEDILTIETQSSRIVQNVIQSSVELASAKESMIKTSLQDAIETKTEPKVKESLDSNGPKYDGPCDLPKSAPMES
uniref:A-kinase anchoring protein 12 n=1 Tax=Monodelphis domestica TaxID=13616 RepID=F6YKX6_MONDO